MANVKGIIIRKETPPSGVANTPDGTSGFICNGVAVPGKLEIGKVYKLKSLRDAQLLGIDEDYDTVNKVLVHYHIKEFYIQTAQTPGLPLYIMIVPQTVTLPAMVEDTTGIYGKKLLNEAKSEIRLLGFGYNPVSYSPTILNGIDADVLSAIPKAQLLADWAFSNSMPINIFIEGKSATGTPTSLANLRYTGANSAPKVSVVIAQDGDVADRDALFARHASIGTVLGAVAARAVNENIGWVQVGNILDPARGRFMNPRLSGGQTIDSVKEHWQTLEDKGYIFLQTYANIDGVYFNGDPTCVQPEVDSNGNINENSVSYGRTIDKAAREVYAALILSVKSPQPVDPATGKLPSGVVGYFKGLAENRIDAAMSGEISGRSVFIDPDSNLVTAPKTLNCGVSVVPFGSADTISVNLALKSTL
jgi:hypothetical protein